MTIIPIDYSAMQIVWSRTDTTKSKLDWELPANITSSQCFGDISHGLKHVSCTHQHLRLRKVGLKVVEMQRGVKGHEADLGAFTARQLI